jgi:HPt (histidine-containing phosphotransfer) domain-containing protein
MKTVKEELPGIIAVLREYSDGEDDMRGLAETFFATADDVLKMLEKSRGASDGQPWVEAAHKLKGSAAMLKADGLCALSEQAEQMGAAAPAEKDRLLADIHHAVEEIRTGLQASFKK